MALPSTPRERWFLLAFGVLSASLLTFAADRSGYEGDDLNSIVPMAHLRAALKGELLVYRYPWQPLSYQIGAWLLRATGTPDAVFLWAPLSASLTLVLLHIAMRRAADRPHRLGLYAALLVLLPELWFSGLYYNTTILGMPLLVAAVLALQHGTPGRARALVAGVLAGTAILLRLDFVMACPLLAALAFRGPNRLRPAVLVAVGVIAVLMVGLASGLLDVANILQLHADSTAELRARASEPGWDARTKLWVASVALHPLGYLMCGGSMLVLLREGWRRDRPRMLALAAGVAALLYPATNLLSPKYLLPLMAFVPLAWVHALEVVEMRWPAAIDRRLELGIIGAALLAMLVAVEPSGDPPFVRVAVDAPRLVGTHDGARTWGAYAIGFLSVNRLRTPSPQERAAQQLWAFLGEDDAQEVVIAGAESVFSAGGVGWRNLQLLLQRAGTLGEVKGPHLLHFDIGPGLWLTDEPKAQVATAPDDAKRLFIDLRDRNGDRPEAKDGASAIFKCLASRTRARAAHR